MYLQYLVVVSIVDVDVVDVCVGAERGDFFLLLLLICRSRLVYLQRWSVDRDVDLRSSLPRIVGVFVVVLLLVAITGDASMYEEGAFHLFL